MKLVELYRQRADECLALAKIAATKEQRDRIAELAQTWLTLAEARARLLANGDAHE